jgi:hypothetical protein
MKQAVLAVVQSEALAVRWSVRERQVLNGLLRQVYEDDRPLTDRQCGVVVSFLKQVQWQPSKRYK